MNVLSWERCDFYISLSCRDMSGNVLTRFQEVLWSIWGSNQTLWSLPNHGQMLHDILGQDDIQWHLPLIRQFTKSWPCYRTRLYYRLRHYYQIQWGFYRKFATGAASQQIGNLQRVRLANRGRLLLQTPGLVPFVLMLRSFSPEIVICFQTLNFEHASILLFCFKLSHN